MIFKLVCIDFIVVDGFEFVIVGVVDGEECLDLYCIIDVFVGNVNIDVVDV